MKVPALFLSTLVILLKSVPLFAQNSPFNIELDDVKGTKSLIESTSGKAIFKNCSSIEGLEFDTSDPELYLVVSGKTVQLYHASSKTSILKKNVNKPEDCYQISKDLKRGKKIITFFTDAGRRSFLISSSGILYPKDHEAKVDNIENITNTSEYLEVWTMGEDEDYDQLVINWDGEEIIGRGKFNIAEFDTINNLFVVEKDKLYGAMDLSGSASIPIEYDFLECTDGFYIVESNNHIGVITPTETILPFQFSKNTGYRSHQYYKSGVFHLQFQNESIDIDTSKSTLNKVNDFFRTYKSAEYYSLKYQTVYEDRQFADEEVVAHIVNSETNQITVPNNYKIGTEHVPHLLSGGVGVIKEGKLGVMNIETGELMIPLEYEPVYLRDIYPGSRYLDTAFRLKWFNRDRKEITDDTVLLIVKKGGRFGIVDLKGNMLVPFLYESIDTTEKCEESDLIMVKQNGLYGLLDKNTFELKIPCEYEFIMDCSRAKKFKTDEEYIELQIAK